MIALVLCSVLAVGEGPPMPEIPENMGDVEEALGVEHATPWRKIGLASTLTGGALTLISASAFTMGLDAERELRSRAHERAEADAILLRRDVMAGIAWPSLVLGLAGVAGGVTMLVITDDEEAP